MVGVLVRLDSAHGDDLGTAHIPIPIRVGDMVATSDSIYRVVDVVISPPGSLIAAMVKVRREHMAVAAR